MDAKSRHPYQFIVVWCQLFMCASAPAADLVVEWLEFDTTPLDSWNKDYREALSKARERGRPGFDVHQKYAASLARKCHPSASVRFQFDAPEGRSVSLTGDIDKTRFNATVEATATGGGRYRVKFVPTVQDGLKVRKSSFNVEVERGQLCAISAGPEETTAHPVDAPPRRQTRVQFYILRLLEKPDARAELDKAKP